MPWQSCCRTPSDTGTRADPRLQLSETQSWAHNAFALATAHLQQQQRQMAVRGLANQQLQHQQYLVRQQTAGTPAAN